jgi:DNA-binding transcriptional ArsR family regulator
LTEAVEPIYNHMVMKSGPALPADALSRTLAALADPTRRSILEQLSLGPASVNDLARPYAMSQPAISKHLKVLEAAGLVSQGQERQRRPRRLELDRLKAAARWLDEYARIWEVRLAHFEKRKRRA